MPFKINSFLNSNTNSNKKENFFSTNSKANISNNNNQTTNHESNNFNINPTFNSNNNNNYIFNSPIFKFTNNNINNNSAYNYQNNNNSSGNLNQNSNSGNKNNENEERYRDRDKDREPFSSNEKNFVKSKTKSKSQMVKIVNMYMREDKKRESKLKLDTLFNKGIKRKKLFNVINKNIFSSGTKKSKEKNIKKTKPKVSSFSKSPYGIQLIKQNFNWSDKKKIAVSRKQTLLEKINFKYKRQKEQKRNLYLEGNNDFKYEDLNLDTYIHIPKKKNKNRFKQKPSNFYLPDDENKDKKASKNIINIVNNLKGKKDSLVKLNINQYDIKCYLPKSDENNSSNNSNMNINSANNFNNSKNLIVNSNSNSNNTVKNLHMSKDSNNNYNVDIINITRKSKENGNGNSNNVNTNLNNKFNSIKSDKEADEKNMKKMRRQILHKVKSYNEDKLKFGEKRPKLSGAKKSDMSINSCNLNNSDRIHFKEISVKDETTESSDGLSDSEAQNSQLENLIQMNNTTDEGSNFTMNEQKGRKNRRKWFEKGKTEKVEKAESDSDSDENSYGNNVALSLPDNPLESHYEESEFYEENEEDESEEISLNSEERRKLLRNKIDITDTDETNDQIKNKKKHKKNFKEKNEKKNTEKKLNFEERKSIHNKKSDKEDMDNIDKEYSDESEFYEETEKSENLEDKSFNKNHENLNKDENLSNKKSKENSVDFIQKEKEEIPSKEKKVKKKKSKYSNLIVLSILEEILTKICVENYRRNKTKRNLNSDNSYNSQEQFSSNEKNSNLQNSQNFSSDENLTKSQKEKKLKLKSESNKKNQSNNDNENSLLNNNSKIRKFSTNSKNLNNSNNQNNQQQADDQKSEHNFADGWSMKYTDEDLKNSQNNSPLKHESSVDDAYDFPESNISNQQITKKKLLKTTSLKPKRNFMFDYINKNDVRKKLFKTKNFNKSKTSKNFDHVIYVKKLVKKNKQLAENFYEKNDSELSIMPSKQQFSLKNIEKNLLSVKNKQKIIKIFQSNDLNTHNIMENPYLFTEEKIKLMHFLSVKNQRKIEIEEKIIEKIYKLIENDLRFCKNNKTSKKILTVHREKKYEIDFEKFNKIQNHQIENPTFLTAKGKVFQENTNYLVNQYFDIYDEILNHIYNSRESIFEFNINIKGDSILKNFRIDSNYNTEDYYLYSNNNNNNKNTNSLPVGSSNTITYTNEKQKLEEGGTSENIQPLRKSSAQFQAENSQSENYSDTKSNFDRLGIANQLYINDILLRDFSIKEKILYPNNSITDKSDSLSDQSYLKFFGKNKQSEKKVTGNLLTIENFVLKKDEKDNKNIIKSDDKSIFKNLFGKKKDSNKEINTSNQSPNIRKKKSKREKPIKKNLKNIFETLVNQNLNDPVIVLNNIFNDKSEVSLLRNKDHLSNLVKTKNIYNVNKDIKSSTKIINKSYKNKPNSLTNDAQKEKKKIMSSTPLTKENTLFKTLEIKSSILKSLNESPSSILRFYIKDGNFVKFKENFERNKNLLNCVDENCDTLLNIAVKCNHYELASYLLDHGADVNIQNKYKNAPLHYALSFKNFKIANLLINKKADEELINGKGYTPWQLLTMNIKIDK